MKIKAYMDKRLNKTLNHGWYRIKSFSIPLNCKIHGSNCKTKLQPLCFFNKELEARSVYSALYFWQWGVLNEFTFVKSMTNCTRTMSKATRWGKNHYRLCVWPGLCTVQSRSSSSVTTVSWAVFRLSSSAVGSTISMELRGEHIGS